MREDAHLGRTRRKVAVYLRFFLSSVLPPPPRAARADRVRDAAEASKAVDFDDLLLRSARMLRDVQEVRHRWAEAVFCVPAGTNIRTTQSRAV